ncbi:MAG TPA: flagellar biosynthetic protein FliO [bacterium]|nr:flagellar biosynthetic protein FliO [bacterium]
MKKSIRILGVATLFLLLAVMAWGQNAATAPKSASGTQAGTEAAVDEKALTLADPGTTNGAAAGTGSSSIVPYIFRMIIVLALVIASIYGLYALLRRSARQRAPSDSYLRVLATTNLAVGRSLHVVALGDKAWLIGSTDSAVSPVAEIVDKELIDALALRAAESPETPRRDFGSMLMTLLGKKGPRSSTSADASDFFSKQRDRLKKF